MILFDLDGTLAHRDTGELLAGVARFFTLTPPTRWAIVTNQGGVGLRRWMEDHGFGDPDRYPAAADIDARIEQVISAIGKQPIAVYVAYAYQTKAGEWAPTPATATDDPRWCHDWRKPAPGMLLQAMTDAGITDPDTVTMVGDSDADHEAAEAAGVRFRWADEFFGRVYALRPGNPRTPLAIKLTHGDNAVYAETPRFLDGLRDVLKGQGMKWDEVRRHWWRELLPRHGTAEDRLVECAVHLLAARFPVNVTSDEIRRRIAECDYTPEQTRWILARVGGKRAGHLVAQWGRDESLGKYLHRIPGVTVYEREALFPPELWDVVLDFVAAHGFSISESALQLIDDARRAYESAYVVDVEPLPQAPAKPADRPTLTADDFGIDEDLADDLADDH